MENHLNYLKQINDFLQKKGIQSELYEKTKTGLAIDVISAAISPDFKNRDQYLTFTFYAVEETLSNNYLQLYTELPLELTPVTQTAFILLLPFLNPKFSVGHLGFNMKELKGYFKYTFLYDESDPKNLNKLNELVELINYSLNMFQNVFKMIEEGISVEVILKTAENIYK